MTAGPFTIRELSGDLRVITLVSRALPYRPYTLKTDQRVELTWLPGSPEATSTILGAKESPTQITGMWKTKYLDTSLTANTGESPPFRLNSEGVFTAIEAVDITDSFVRLGQLLEVTWLTQTRLGHLRSFEKRWLNRNDVEWTMDFEWISRGEIPGPAVFITTQTSSDAVGEARAAFNVIDEIPFPTNFGLTTPFVTTVTEFTRNLQDAIFDLESSIVSSTNRFLTPAQTTRGLISTFRSIEDEADLMVGFLNSQVAGNMNTNTEVEDNQSFAEVLEAERFRRALIVWVLQLKRRATENRDQLTDQIAGELAGTFKATEGQDLRDVSRLFYKTPFEWRRIMTFNNLRTAELQAGQTVLVPKFNPQEANQLVQGA